MPLVGVDQIVRLQQDLVVRAVHPLGRVVVAHQIDHPVPRRLGEAGVPEEFLRQNYTLPLLVLAVGIAVFLPAEGTGDVMDQGRGLQNGLGLRRKALPDADGPGVGVDLQKVVDIVEVPFGTLDHLFCQLCDQHAFRLLRMNGCR